MKDKNAQKLRYIRSSTLTCLEFVDEALKYLKFVKSELKYIEKTTKPKFPSRIESEQEAN